MSGLNNNQREDFRKRRQYSFQGEVVDVGLGVYGHHNIIGPIVLTAMFLPTERHMDTLLRHNLQSGCNFYRETLRECSMYNRILTLNYTELGFLVKAFDPQTFSNTILSEGPDHATLFELGVKTYKNFLKVITKKLKFKINAVYYRQMRPFNRPLYEALACAFPQIKFVIHCDDDQMSTRNLSNISNLFANQFYFQRFIWNWSFPEIE